MFFWQIILNSLVLGTQVLLLAVPLYLVYSVSKIYHLALGAVGIAAAYGLYFALSNNLPLIIAIAISVLVSLVLSIASYLLLEASARKKEAMFGLLLSLAFGITLESLIAIIFKTDAKSIIGGVLPTIALGDLYITVPGIITIVVGFFLAVFFILLVKKTPWGRDLRSVAENNSLSSSITINSSLVRLSVFVIAGLLAGFVAIMTVMNTALTPQAGFPLVILAFVAMFIGGVFDIRGLVISSYLVTLVPELIISLSPDNLSLSSNWKMAIVFMLAIIILAWRPNGLFTNKVRVD
ncbi:MAG: branched-chain amino acid ABC transporter permease [Candidatus Falkowbacteria bacterium]|nr:branched-chain amino acid ABC transporter permease [Candidatus Falkowbacteria bacterium]